MKFITIQHSTPRPQALNVSRELFNISRPEKEDEDITQYLFGHIEHPVSGEISLVVYEDFDLRVHPDASGRIDALGDLLDQCIEAGEINRLKGVLNSSERVRFENIIPAMLEVKTKTEMETDGWFSDPEAP